jgi:hypothetical protein
MNHEEIERDLVDGTHWLRIGPTKGLTWQQTELLAAIYWHISWLEEQALTCQQDVSSMETIMKLIKENDRSGFLAAIQEVPGSIPGAARFSD